MPEIFDFGFTAVNEDELEVTQTMHTMVNEAKGAQEKLDALYNAIVPLLNNLKQNPEKEYIKWPDRLSKVEQFETHLQKIYKGS
jgi:hypothetical protein